MLVKVKLFANFRKNRFKEKEMDLEDNCTVGWVIDYLKIPRKELGVVFLNGLSTTPEAILHAGDTLSIFPMVGGG
ncbi:MAG TPA: MoaD/ThiS family protein [Syntrophomonadaceae bacterium]|nr:MoaD/ThiS family protein [Syntrophomonadaceae bacterium]HRX21384.1 MoaD/ThiS family protein [Syntrophomonadaceae bacterium]